MRSLPKRIRFATAVTLVLVSVNIVGRPLPSQELDAIQDRFDSVGQFQFNPLPDLPDPVGVAGALVGLHRDRLIVAGGANFAPPDAAELWQVPKRYHRRIYVMVRSGGETVASREPGDSRSEYRWLDDNEIGAQLPEPVGYGASVSTEWGVVGLGGENEQGLSRRAFLIGWFGDSEEDLQLKVLDSAIPDLPTACTAGGAAVVDEFVYLVAGAIEGPDGKPVASRHVWRLPLAIIAESIASNRDINQRSELWEPVIPWPKTGPERMFPLVTAQHDGFGTRLFVIGGRRFLPGKSRDDLNNLQFLSDAWSLAPQQLKNSLGSERASSTGRNDADESAAWRRLADPPVPMAAGTAVPVGPSHIFVPAYADGSILQRWLASGVDQASFPHPGFPRQTWGYHTIVDAWVPWNESPVNQVTSRAVVWGDDVFLISGEVRPRVRTPNGWRIRFVAGPHQFGAVDLGVVAVYLLGVLMLGVWFTFRNRSTDDYFRGGGRIPWWVAGCSIFATMLSSITYMAIPAKAFAQDWVYSLGSVMILVVAPIAIGCALPFFRQLDITSAYEYLERRFNRPTRWLASASFTLFHVFRIGIVLALAGLALSSVIPLTAIQCVAVMGCMAIVYCTLGGITAVVWTDTAQTFVLLGGAIACLVAAWVGADPGAFAAAEAHGKLKFVNVDFGSGSFATMAVWVVVLGAFGQNIASYTADQAVVQRYMTTPRARDAASAIWLNGWMAIPAMIIFFGLGTAFWMFYRSHPQLLDPTMATDRILPLFVSTQLPVGLAGLVVAGIFAAAQSTVSTSMNSGATTVITDFVTTVFPDMPDRRRLWLARWITLLMGVTGTIVGLWFVDPTIRSLFDQFIGVLGLCLGVLAGLFALGVWTRRAHGAGGLIAAIVSLFILGTLAMASSGDTTYGLAVRDVLDGWHLPLYRVHPYLYAFLGLGICYVLGYGLSCLVPGRKKPLEGLTWWDRRPAD